MALPHLWKLAQLLLELLTSADDLGFSFFFVSDHSLKKQHPSLLCCGHLSSSSAPQVWLLLSLFID